LKLREIIWRQRSAHLFPNWASTSIRLLPLSRCSTSLIDLALDLDR